MFVLKFRHMKVTNGQYLRSAMFGFNDALVSTTGVIVGVSVGTGDKSTIILAGVVTILVEAISMGTGEYNSVKSANQFTKSNEKTNPALSGLIMFCAYFTAGLVPLAPVFFLPVDTARAASIIFALIGLFILGYFKGKIVKVSPLRSATEILIIGALATGVGLLAGTLLKV
jgi:VIT1/CCC1 family predicted Fe2+/Mn2+ transporter